MSEDINFLPKELRPKVRRGSGSAASSATVLSQPLADRAVSNVSKPAPRMSWFARTTRSPLRSPERDTLLASIAKPTTPTPKRLARTATKRRWWSPSAALRRQFTMRAKPQSAPPAPAQVPPVIAKTPATSRATAPTPRPAAPVPLPRTVVTGGRSLINTNLLKGQELVFFNWHKTVFVHASAVVVTLCFVALSAWYVSMLERDAIAHTNPFTAQLDARQTSLAQLQTQAAALQPIREKAQLIQDMLDTHVYWTNFFTYLEAHTLPGVYYLGLSGDLSGIYELVARTRDFKTFVAQTQTWQEEETYTTSATVQAMETVSQQDIRTGGQAQAIEFDLTLTVDPSIFYTP